MREYFFENSENKIYYRKNEFKSDRPTLIFVHGAVGSSSAWIPYERIFENKYNILSYDIRGHGKSKKFPNYADYEIKKFANDLHNLITYLNINKFILISNSFAGLIALEYLKLHRNTVIANVFTSPEIFLNEGFLAKVMRLIFSLGGIFPFHPEPRGHVDYKKHIGSTDWDIGRNLADMRNTTLRVHFHTLRQSFNQKQEYELGKINVPTLIIHGERDSMVPMKNVLRMHREIKNSEFVSIPNVDHNTVHNGVKVMSQAIENFIEKYKKSF